MTRKIISKILAVISALLFLAALILFIFWLQQGKAANSEMSEMQNQFAEEIVIDLADTDTGETVEVESTSVDTDDLQTNYQNAVGWIKVPGTSINYPVAQGSNNSYYLNHGINGRYNANGAIFLDYRNSTSLSDRNTVIYGHNMLNGAMFGTLSKVRTSSWYRNKANHYITYQAGDNTYIAQVFSVHVIEKTDLYYTTINFSDDDFVDYINKVKSLSEYNFNVDVGLSDKIITLYTCTNHSQSRILVHAKILNYEDSEDPAE